MLSDSVTAYAPLVALWGVVLAIANSIRRKQAAGSVPTALALGALILMTAGLFLGNNNEHLKSLGLNEDGVVPFVYLAMIFAAFVSSIGAGSGSGMGVANVLLGDALLPVLSLVGIFAVNHFELGGGSGLHIVALALIVIMDMGMDAAFKGGMSLGLGLTATGVLAVAAVFGLLRGIKKLGADVGLKPRKNGSRYHGSRHASAFGVDPSQFILF